MMYTWAITMMTKDKENLIRHLHESEVKREEYINSIPVDLRDSIFDNTYSDSIAKDLQLAVAMAIGKELMVEFEWFMWDMPKSGGDIRYPDGHVIKITDIDSFIKHLYYFYP